MGVSQAASKYGTTRQSQHVCLGAVSRAALDTQLCVCIVTAQRFQRRGVKTPSSKHATLYLWWTSINTFEQRWHARCRSYVATPVCSHVSLQCRNTCCSCDLRQQRNPLFFFNVYMMQSFASPTWRVNVVSRMSAPCRAFQDVYVAAPQMLRCCARIQVQSPFQFTNFCTNVTLHDHVSADAAQQLAHSARIEMMWQLVLQAT